MSYALLAVGLVSLVLALNALWPPRRFMALVIPGFFSSWLTIEMAPQLLVLEAAGLGLLAAYGGLDAWPGWIGLIAGLVGIAGTVATIVASRRTVVTLRDSDVPLDLDPEGAPRYPFSHLVVPQLCLIPRRGVQVVRNVVFREEGRLRLKLDVYRPKTERMTEPKTDGTLRPGLMQIHGGGWVIGDKREQGLPLLNHMAVQGWVGFNVNYRLSPRATWPEHLLDLKHFIAWYREHAAEYGADPDFLCVTGGSAGGHLAAMVALSANEPEFQPGFEDVDTSVRGAVPFYGVYDFVEAGPWPIPFGANALVERMMVKRSFKDEPEAFAAASPVSYLRQDAPPFFVIHGSKDTLIPVPEARRFVKKLRDVSDAPVLYAEMKGGQHAFDVFPSYRTARVVEGVERYLTGLHRQYLQGRPPSVPDEVSDSVG
ncbi:alpha/beta hydrolase [Actinomadura barringtoniae]|uniref:Alpha/beta hydrolase n=1 Tax=Actinomadura barringtoniae TaxID=1427535 RepID=A0A939T3G4_9ACTN|nr:alpha/beta hydrolase [Actinomadura barringtoniae]MBO2446619.1 alpha/beta hydrolase [Actinomadura barringtoniae]